MQCKDIPDELFVAHVGTIQRATGLWCNYLDLADRMCLPEKLVLAKARKLIKKGLITGCACGCRGDFEVVGLLAEDG